MNILSVIVCQNGPIFIAQLNQIINYASIEAITPTQKNQLTHLKIQKVL